MAEFLVFSAEATLQPADGHRGGREATGAVPVCEAALLGAARSLSLSLIAACRHIT